MNEKHTKQLTLRISDYDCYDHLTPHAILDFFQDVAGEHADMIGVGFNKMIKEDLIWVLVRTKYIVKKYPPLYSSVNVTTWPREKGRLDFDREYLIEDENGETLIEGLSKWVVVNVKTRRLAMSRNINYECEILPHSNFEKEFPKLEDFDESNLTPFIEKTTFSDLDHNGHVNNANYARYILNAIQLTKEQTIKEFEIDHIKELMPNSLIKIFFKDIGGAIIVKGLSEEGELSFLARVVL